MDKFGYYRYRQMLQQYGFVCFPTRKDLIEFFSIHVSNLYRDWINKQASRERDTERIRKWVSRELSEGILVEVYVKEFLEQHVVHQEDVLYRMLPRVMKRMPNMFKMYVDQENKELYEFVLKRIAKGDNAADVFPENVKYLIEGNCKLSVSTT